MNYMSEVAKMLGVELGERFRLYDDDREYEVDYYFLEDGIYVGIPNKNHRANSGLLFDIVTGEYNIKRKPWRPEEGDGFWYMDADGGVYHYSNFNSTDADYVNYYKLGNCYRTKEEVEANREKWKAFYASDEVLEV